MTNRLKPPPFSLSSPRLNPLCVCLGGVCVCMYVPVDSWASLEESGLHSNEISLPSWKASILLLMRRGVMPQEVQSPTSLKSGLAV